MTSLRFFLIRHGESTWNVARRWQGWADPPLSQAGEEQARDLARRLAGEPIEVVVTSDLRRARQTAAAVGAVVGVEPVVDPRLRELDVGRWSGLTRAEIEACDAEALAAFASGDPEAKAGGAESRGELARRVRAAFGELAEAHAGARAVALVAHRGVVHALLPGRLLANADFRSATNDEISAGWRSDAGSARPAAG